MSALALPASADRLLLKDGTSLETRGSFVIKGRLVVFTRPNGTLASLRVDEVDLDASRPAPTAKPPLPEESVNQEPALDEARKDGAETSARLPEALPLEEDERAILPISPPDSQPSSAQENGEIPHLLVQSWERVLGEDGEDVEIRGSLHNHGETVASQVTMVITALSTGDRILGRQPAVLSQSSVSPGSAVSFSALFPDLGPFEALRFQVESQRLEFDPRP